MRPQQPRPAGPARLRRRHRHGPMDGGGGRHLLPFRQAAPGCQAVCGNPSWRLRRGPPAPPEPPAPTASPPGPSLRQPQPRSACTGSARPASQPRRAAHPPCHAAAPPASSSPMRRIHVQRQRQAARRGVGATGLRGAARTRTAPAESSAGAGAAQPQPPERGGRMHHQRRPHAPQRRHRLLRRHRSTARHPASGSPRVRCQPPKQGRGSCGRQYRRCLGTSAPAPRKFACAGGLNRLSSALGRQHGIPPPLHRRTGPHALRESRQDLAAGRTLAAGEVHARFAIPPAWRHGAQAAA